MFVHRLIAALPSRLPRSLWPLMLLALTACGNGGDGSNGFVLSGTLDVPGFVLTDADVNDINVSNGDNNSPLTAQLIPNPVNVGGYVNTPGSGPAGRTNSTGDTSDFYQVELEANQTILLNIGDFESGDLDLALYDQSILTNAQAIPVATSEGVSKYESIVVATAGTYYIRVYPYTGEGFFPARNYSNYLLSVGLTPVSELQQYRDAGQGDFVPGEIIASPLANVTFSALAVNTLQAAGLSIKQQSADGTLLLSVGGQSSAAFSATASNEDRVAQKKATLNAIRRLQASGQYRYVQPNYRRHAMRVPNDTYYGYQWHYPLINLPAAWDITVGDASAVVAVIDTGVLLNHPDLAGQLIGGYDFISDSRVSGDGDGIDSNADDPGDGGTYNASSFHGTHVAGTIAASSHDADGVAGVAWGAKIMPLRVLGEQGGSDYDIAQAIRYAAALANDSGTLPNQAADVINLSLGGADSSAVLAEAVAAAQQAGVIVVAAAGNESTSAPSYPAANSGVISVSAVDINRQLAPYSNFGNSIDVAAPGGDTTRDLNGDGRGDGVLSTAGDDSTGSIRFSYAIYQGTSMAAPHVAGVVALMKSVYPDLTPAEFNTALQSGVITRDLGSVDRDNLYGYGLIDAYKAVVEAQKLAGGTGTVVDPDVALNPQSVSFGLLNNSATLYIDEIGSGNLAVNSVVSSENWLSYQRVDVDAAGFGTYRLNAARSLLSPGTYTASVTVTSSNDGASVVVTRELDVLIQVLDSSVTGFAGLAYLQLINMDTDEVLDQLQVSAVAGLADFRFDAVPAGNYLIFAGTDMDNDGTICDAGEACGAYPTEDQARILEIDGSRSGLDFLFTYPYESPTSSAAGVGKVQRKGYRLLGK